MCRAKAAKLAESLPWDHLLDPINLYDRRKARTAYSARVGEEAVLVAGGDVHGIAKRRYGKGWGSGNQAAAQAPRN